MRKLKILCAEDLLVKYQRVKTELSNIMLDKEIEFTWAEDYERAVDALSNNYFDVLLLDLLLPGAANGPDITYSKALVTFIEDGRSVNAPLIIGLTADSKAYDANNRYFTDRLLLLERYDEIEVDWAQRIADKLLQLARSRSTFLDFFARSKGIDLIILAARYPTEFSPIVETIKWSNRRPNEEKCIGDTTMVRGRAIVGGKDLDTMVVSMSEMGLSTTATIATLLIERYRPEYMAMLGMCCGFRAKTAARQLKLLDVSIAESALCWDEGKYYDDKAERGISGFSYRPNPAHMPDNIASIAKKFVEEKVSPFNTRAARLLKKAGIMSAIAPIADQCSEKPAIHFGLNVSGNCIVSRKTLVDEIVDRNPTAQSLEMEIYALMLAVSKMDGYRPTLVCAKGVADFGEEKDPALYDPIQPIASKMSFYAFDELLKLIINKRQDSRA